jgi:hypothetical protein
MLCAQCGFANQPQAKFWGACGTALLPHAGASTALPVVPRSQAPLSYTPAHLAGNILTIRSRPRRGVQARHMLFSDLKSSMEPLADRHSKEARQLLDPVVEWIMGTVHH